MPDSGNTRSSREDKSDRPPPDNAAVIDVKTTVVSVGGGKENFNTEKDDKKTESTKEKSPSEENPSSSIDRGGSVAPEKSPQVESVEAIVKIKGDVGQVKVDNQVDEKRTVEAIEVSPKQFVSNNWTNCAEN